MNQKHRNIALKSLHLLGVVLLCQALGAAARSIQRLKPEEKDPMMALPSGQEYQQAVQYVYQQVAPIALAHAHTHTHAEPVQEMVVEYQPQVQVQTIPQAQQEQQYEVIQIQGQHQPRASEPAAHHSHDGIDCNQRHEFTALLDQREEPMSRGGAEPGEYPGQLIYVGQNGNEAANMKNAAGSWSQASDLTATILTEVPVKDMPQEVLKKLKRDYGVKVVATRERPGANLVINCDEYASQENSICNRHVSSHETNYRIQPVVNHVQVEAVVQAPRDQVHAYQHVAQPSSEPGHVYVQEGPVENQQGGEDSRATGESEYNAGGQADEQGGQEGAVSEPAAGAPSYENQNNENDKGAALSQAAGRQSEEAAGDANGEAPQADQRSGAHPADARESYELGTGFDDQHSKGADESSWQSNNPSQGRDGETTMRHGAADWSMVNEESKQVARAETNSGAQQTTR